MLCLVGSGGLKLDWFPMYNLDEIDKESSRLESSSGRVIEMMGWF